jgi:amino acid adenylation domain-containing protein
VNSPSVVLEGILDQADRRPDRPAVKDLDRDLSYSALRDEAGVVAASLAARGVGKGDRVALHLPNSVDFVVAALACLWAGATFVPLAVTDPDARLAAILEDCDPNCVVTFESHAETHASTGLDRFAWVPISELRSRVAEPTQPDSDPRRAAYSIYTSGTTGTPKGVMIANSAFVAAVRATAAALDLHGDTRTLCVSPFHFDGSFGTLFPTLFSGGAVVIRPREALLYPRTFFNAVIQESITHTGFSPSYLRLLLSSPQVNKLSGTALQSVALGGEASSPADIRAFWEAAPQVQIFNRYGPTEATIAVTHIKVTPELIADGIIPIGRPHPGVTFHLVDDRGEIVEDSGRVGELYIGGTQLMDGYWGEPGLTADVLRGDVVPGETVYRTGDLVYRDSDGDYVYVDRADRVVKRNGVRISLVEMGESFRNLAEVSSAVCVTFDDDGQVGIVAFVVAGPGVTPLGLQRAAREVLPDTMLPNRILLVEALPLTAASKLDERRLLAEAGLREISQVRRAGEASGSRRGL